MNQKPLVSIICLCYNHEKFVVESLQAVVNQSYKNIELIVVDDCSSDNSVSVIKKWLLDFPDIQFIVNEKNLGNTKTFNSAVKFAKGDYLIDLAADDILLKNCVALQIEKFQNSLFKNLGLVYGNCENIDEQGNFDSYYFEVDKNKNTIEKRKTGDVYASVISTGKAICSVSALVKRAVFDALNGYDENLAYEDLDLWIRISRNYNIDFIDEILVQKRIVSNSMSTHFFKRNSKLNHSTFKILKKTIALNRNLTEDLAVQKRVHYEIILAYKNRNVKLLFKNLGLKMWLVLRKIF
jgi:glycosyltransferase involved in cell wall biosynthesis